TIPCPRTSAPARAAYDCSSRMIGRSRQISAGTARNRTEAEIKTTRELLDRSVPPGASVDGIELGPSLGGACPESCPCVMGALTAIGTALQRSTGAPSSQ